MIATAFMRQLGIDQVELRKINVPAGKAPLGPALPNGSRTYASTTAYPLALRFYQNRPSPILDAPQHMAWDAINISDPETPVGARGIGEPPAGGACAAVLNPISDAHGDDVFRRAPVMLDVILMSLEAGHPVHEPLTAHI